MPEVIIAEIKPQLVLGIRKTGAYLMIPELIGKLCAHAAAKNIAMTGAPVFVCHEASAAAAAEAQKNASADVEVAIPINTKTEDIDDIKCYEIPGGKVAKIIHRGPYDQCGTAYGQIFAWIAQNGITVTGPIREVYLNDPKTVAPEEILTEIVAPIS